jgi:hypothetical protein
MDVRGLFSRGVRNFPAMQKLFKYFFYLKIKKAFYFSRPDAHVFNIKLNPNFQKYKDGGV